VSNPPRQVERALRAPFASHFPPLAIDRKWARKCDDRKTTEENRRSEIAI